MPPQMGDKVEIRGNEVNGESSKDDSIEFGKLLASPAPGDEVVISGLSGCYPDSEDVYHFRDNLFNKVNLISDDERRWKPAHPEIPQKTGKIFNVEKFDPGFFGIHRRQANAMDPMLRVLLEKVTEAIFDAGLHPSDLEGTNTGVFIGACFSESEKTWFFDKLASQTFAVTGVSRSMLANRVSYFLKLKSFSLTTDTACSSSLYAFEHAYRAIRTGICDKAIVAGTNICLHPYVSLQFARLGVTSLDGCCRVFDEKANGYARSEAVSVVLLEKAKDSKRLYSTVLHSKTNCDGYKNSGITFPSKDMQRKLLQEFYKECRTVSPYELSFLEAHGTGTKVGDPEELQAMEEVFVKDRKTPLMIGSVKSNIGHSEPASGVCSITKVIIATESGFIPPNINFETPRMGIASLHNGAFKVVTEKTPFADNRGLVGINSFGFGGSNCHVLLKHNVKEKVNHGKAKDNLPRLVCVSGRTKEAVKVLFDDVMENHIDVEQVALLYNIFRKTISNHRYRGYLLASKNGEITRSTSYYEAINKPLLVVAFGVTDTVNIEKAKDIFEVPLFSGIIYRIHKILETKAINISDLILNANGKQYTNLESLLSRVTIQATFAEALKQSRVQPDYIFGVNKGSLVGTLLAAFFDDAISLEDLINCVYEIGLALDSHPKGKENEPTVSNNKKISSQIQNGMSRILKKLKSLSKKVILDSQCEDKSYFINSFDSNDNLKHIKPVLQKNTTILEIGNGHIEGILDQEFKKVKHFTFINTGTELKHFLISLGRLYEIGFNPQVQNLYPQVKFPVSRGTPMISPKIRWKHDDSWWVTTYNSDEQLEVEERIITVALKDQFTFLAGHVVDGRNLFPATGYLYFAWETLAQVHGLMMTDMKVVFENCKFRRACALPRGMSKIEFTVLVQRGTGNFEIVEGGVTVVTGKIILALSGEADQAPLPLPVGINKQILSYLTTKDIYKELRLRGYMYKNEFKALKSCDNSAQVGEIAWTTNWITFMDNMLQMKILQEDTRLLYVPTSIARVSIDAKKHFEYAQSFGEKAVLPVTASRETGIIRSGGIEIRGLHASSIARRKYLGTPVLEKFVFVPHIAKLNLEQIIRVDTQLLLENLPSIKVKVAELIDDATPEHVEPLGDIVYNVLGDQPLIQPDITILSKTEIEVKNSAVKVEDQKLLTQTDCSLIIGSKILQRNNILQIAFGSIKENGFILSREALDFDSSNSTNQGISILTVFSTDLEKFVFFRKSVEFETTSVIKISSEDEEFNWLSTLKALLEKNSHILMYAENESLNGAMGLVNCVRRETGGKNVKLVFLASSAPEFSITDAFYLDQLKKNLAINVYKDGHWGTYRHLLFEHPHEIEVEHCYLNSTVRGDISSLKWIEGPLSFTHKTDHERTLVFVYYAALNFRDVMTASGRINVDAITTNRREQECIQGFEFSGRTQDGKRVMGMVTNGACASLIEADNYILFDVPENWTLQEAATIPVVYGTCLYGLGVKGKMKRGESILIHAGTGGIGQAAISIALDMGCTVYTTVGTPEKREFLKKKFPQLTDKHISCSRDTSFEKHIITVTNGRGVDLVLNSLAEEKLLASIRCLARGGRFIEIGKYDLAMDNTMNLLLLEKEASFHGVMVDAFFKEIPAVKRQLTILLDGAIKDGLLRPLNRTIFKMDQAEEAFRFMATGKHTGKVLIEIRKEEKDLFAIPPKTKFTGVPKYHCDKDKTYIICGGLGGFGLELADWLALRGCTKLVLSSRTGIKNGYQSYRISIWRSYGINVQVATDDITTYEGCESLLTNSNKLGPVHAIFNLAVVLKDGLLENQDKESFKTSFGPKVYATQYLDQLSRKLCPQLRDFVVFSSVVCGRGNAGQTNYGMANSIMERIIECRKKSGYPALAIEWGAIGDVGLVADMRESDKELEIGGTLQQPILNCLMVLNTLLHQNESPIVSSIVVAEKKSGAGGADNIVTAVANILGIKDIKSVGLNATLAEIGMDSMTAVEVKQTLERDFEVFLTPQDLKSLTFARLLEIQAEKDAESQGGGTKKERALRGFEMVVKFREDETTSNMPIMSIQGKQSNKTSLETIVIFPGIDGLAKTLEPLYKNIEANLVGLQFPNNTQKDTIPEMTATVLPYVEEKITSEQPFKIISYSFGGCIALEAAKVLEEKGFIGTLILIDTSPDYLQALVKFLEVDIDDKFQVSLLVQTMAIHLPYETVSKHILDLYKCNTFEERMKLSQKIAAKDLPFSPEFQRESMLCLYKRLKAVDEWKPEFKLKSKIVLYKASLSSIELDKEDFGLSRFSHQPIEVKKIDGNHETILENPDLLKSVNETFGIASEEQANNADKEMEEFLKKRQAERQYLLEN